MSNGNGSVAPVCPVSRGQTPPGMAPTQAPQIPQATDLPSAIAALAQMILAQHLPQVPANNVAPPFPAPLPGTGTTGSGTSKRPGWVEIGRSLEPHRIYNPDDDSVFVELNRITYLQFQESKTQTLFTWALGYGQID